MLTTYFLVLYLVSLALGYQLRFSEATLHIGRSLSTTGSKTGFQDAITPPNAASLGFGIYGLSLAVLAFGFMHYGATAGITALFLFGFCLAVNRVVFLPTADSQHFHKIIIGSMIRRHADYVRDGDKLRAAAMVDLLQRAGVSLEFLTP